VGGRKEGGWKKGGGKRERERRKGTFGAIDILLDYRVIESNNAPLFQISTLPYRWLCGCWTT
jgi:hypothetical protein